MDFVFLSTIDWELRGGVYPPVPWARDLVRRGHRVLYVQTEPHTLRAGSQNPIILSLAELGMPERALRRAWNGLPPGDLGAFVENFLARLSAFQARETEARVAVWSDPFVPLILLLPELRARGYSLVYDCKDDFESLYDLGYRFGNRAAERYLVRECDLTTVLTPPLLEKLLAWNLNPNIRLLREGVDVSEFRPRVPRPPSPPADLMRGERTLGYWGLVNDFNIDVPLLGHLARARPAWTVNLIGPVDSDPARKPIARELAVFPNIHLLGEKPHSRLADYLAWFDVTLIPYPFHPYNLSRDPIKVFEYLAGHKPVAAAHAPTLRDMPHVYLADTPDAFLTAVETALARPVDTTRLDAYLSTCSWSARVDQLLAWVAERTPRAAALPTLTPEQFYPPENIPPHLRAYLAHAEQLLDERTAYIAHMEREWGNTQRYLRRLEKSHPAIWLRRVVGQGRRT